MRIGIITQPLANNYGGILQNWALQQVLKKMGHEPYTIRILYRAKDRLWAFRWLIHDLRSLLSIFKGKKVSFINPISYYINYQRSLRPKCTFKEFVSNHINRTRMYDICPKRAISDYKFDALITGSDQV